MFSLVTSTTDEGMGAWYGDPDKRFGEMGMMDVLKEVVRPIVSVLAVEYMFQVSYVGFHNPMRSFSFMNFLIALAAKDLSVGGCALLAQNVDAAGKQLDLLETMTDKMRIASRFRSKKSGDA